MREQRLEIRRHARDRERPARPRRPVVTGKVDGQHAETFRERADLVSPVVARRAEAVQEQYSGSGRRAGDGVVDGVQPSIPTRVSSGAGEDVMKAIRVSEYGGPSVLKLEEVPAPQPAQGQVLVRNHAVGVNPVDTYLRSNTDNRGPKLPYTPGSDAAGVIEAVGPGVTGVKPGDRVYVGGSMSGAYAEMSLCTEAQVHPLPATASFAQGAAMNVPYGTAYHALVHRGHGAEGETVLVHGASGGVGIAAVQIARARGMTVIGTAGTARGRQLVLEQGAHHALDHTAPGYLKELTDLTGGRGPDLILEMLANVNLQNDLGVIAMRGRIVVIGNRGTIEINARLAMNKDAAILGMALFHASPAQLAGIHAALVEGLRNGTLRPVIGQEIPLGQAARAHEAVMEAGHYGKIVLVP
jgi:NADPH2:quinone reductase